MAIKIKGNGIFLTTSSEVDQLDRKTYQLISKLINSELEIIKKKIQKRFFPWKSRGRKYPSRKPGALKMHTASLPNYPPNMDTGELRKAIKIRGSLKGDNLEIVAELPKKFADYAFYLEAGTEKIKPRPYFYQTIEKRLETQVFRRRMNQVVSAINNELIGKNGIFKDGDWELV